MRHKDAYDNFAGGYMPTFDTKAPPRSKKLKAGFYNVLSSMQGLFLKEDEGTDEKLLEIPDPSLDAAFHDLERFWSAELEEKYNRYNLVYKRGILLHGKPGTGKTCLIKRLARKIVSLDGLAFINPPLEALGKIYEQILEVEGKSRKVLVVFEELEQYIPYDEYDLLELLDGQVPMHNAAFVATTNYIEKIPDRIKKRPSRFNRVIEVGTPVREAREMYLRSIICEEDIADVDVEKWLDASEGMTIDQLKEMVINVMCHGMSIKKATKASRYFDLNEE